MKTVLDWKDCQTNHPITSDEQIRVLIMYQYANGTLDYEIGFWDNTLKNWIIFDPCADFGDGAWVPFKQYLGKPLYWTIPELKIK